MKNVIAAAAVGLAALLTAPAARAQVYVPPPTSPFPRPTISPYLNLYRGALPGINYYGIVRPQLDTTAALAQLQRNQQALQLGAGIDPSTGLPYTGHPTRFFAYGNFFFNQGGAAGVFGAGAPGGPAPFGPAPLGGPFAGTVPPGGAANMARPPRTR